MATDQMTPKNKDELKLMSKDDVLVFVPKADFSREGEDIIKKIREDREQRIIAPILRRVSQKV